MALVRILDDAVGERPALIPGVVLGSGGVAGGPFQVVGLANLSATTDPGPSNDSTQGYQAGSVWVNTAAGALRWWECRSAAAGAAAWVFGGADYTNGGTNPSNEVTQFGQSSALMAEEGNINRQISTAGVQPASTGADIVLAVYSLPANAFDVAGRGINVQAAGSSVNNGNTKRMKIIYNATTAVVGQAVTGGTVIADSGAITTAGGGWSLTANVFKASAANTQLSIHEAAQAGSVIGPLVAPSTTTAPENAAILIAVTGNAASATTDITFNFLDVNAMN